MAGSAGYPRVLGLGKFREIAGEVGAPLMADVAHKPVRGPRVGMTLFQHFESYPDIKERIDMAVFPGLQRGPPNLQIGTLAAQLL